MKAVQKILVSAAFLLFLTPAATTAQQNQSPRVSKGPSDPVVLTVTITNEKGQFIGGLQQSDFEVLENKVAQTITSFSNLDAPASIGILFDVSRSMAGSSGSESNRKLQTLSAALGRFLTLNNPSNEYFVVGFSSQPWMPLEWTSDRQAVIESLPSFDTKSSVTALYDACYAGVQKVMEGRYNKRVIILISDGQDNSSRHTFGQLRRLLKESTVLLYSLGVGGGDDAGSSLGMDAQGILDELSTVSGGKAFFPRKAAETIAVFEGIGQELHSHYALSFAPAPSTGKETWHKIKVRVSPPTSATRKKEHLYVRAREGYYQY